MIGPHREQRIQRWCGISWVHMNLYNFDHSTRILSGLKTGGDRLTRPADGDLTVRSKSKYFQHFCWNIPIVFVSTHPFLQGQLSFGIRQVRCLTPSQAAQRNSGRDRSNCSRLRKIAVHRTPHVAPRHVPEFQVYPVVRMIWVIARSRCSCALLGAWSLTNTHLR